MLTTEDRRWLTGEKSYEGEHAKQQRYQRRRDIRQRVHNSILDFSILFEHLEDAEREKLFEKSRVDGIEEFERGLRDALAFVLYGAGLTETMDRAGSDRPASLADHLLWDAVERAGRRDDILVESVDLAIEATDGHVATIVEKLRSDENVSPTELAVLLESGEVDTDDVRTCIRKELFDDE